jgi:hypothetical protein
LEGDGRLPHRREILSIAERAPRFALLDVNLGAETNFEIAEQLAEQNIRFAFATGYGEQVVFPAAFADAPRLRKPYAPETLRAVLAASLG